MWDTALLSPLAPSIYSRRAPSIRRLLKLTNTPTGGIARMSVRATLPCAVLHRNQDLAPNDKICHNHYTTAKTERAQATDCAEYRKLQRSGAEPATSGARTPPLRGEGGQGGEWRKAPLHWPKERNYWRRGTPASGKQSTDVQPKAERWGASGGLTPHKWCATQEHNAGGKNTKRQRTEP